ncbi:family 2 glycosyl transferase [Sphaerisporangium melleum]|uniref:family 2 glycosyl transferase n=1 Tax=Sphaerisporangium melleum TaxID=321316 RepID=UPI00166CFD53|nr:family 2 glycosyl transferase [Sphaerisporangium melleum]
MAEGDPTPLGYVRTPSAGAAELSFQDGRPLPAGQEARLPLTAADIVPLRGYAGLRVRWPAGPEGVLETILALAAAGVPVHGGDAPGWLQDADPGLARLLASWEPGPGDPSVRSVSDLRREEHSVRLRRHAFRRATATAPVLTGNGGALGAGTTAGSALRDTGAGGLGATASGAAPTPKVSVVMSSRRPTLLGSALAQIARQRHVEVEVLLGLHGVPAAHPDVRRAVEAFPLPLTVVEADAATPFGRVLHDVAARASGDDIAKWDDDDWYSPEHLADLLMARAYSGADIVGTAAEFFYLEPLNTTVRRTDYTSEVWSDHVAGGTILLARETYQHIGGFEGVERGVDAQLLKTAHTAGARIYRTHGLGYVLRRTLAAGHTWQLPLAHFLRVSANQWRGFRPSRILETA